MNQAGVKRPAPNKKAPRTNRRNQLLFLGAAVVVLVLLVVWIVWGNTALEVSKFIVSSEKLPEVFSGYRIAQISDLHNAQFGEKNSQLLELLESTEPDCIVLTGDLVDSRRTDVEVAVSFAEQAVEIAPVYYVNGNHEARIEEYEALKAGLEKAGVTVMENQVVPLECSGQQIYLAGVNDPGFQTDFPFDEPEQVLRWELEQVTPETDGYWILLSHRPEYFDLYEEFGADLVFSGHAHGGQIQLPVIGGLAAPGQGFFPKYDDGLYTEGSTSMLVSRGLGNSLFPFRVNNRPEILVAELRCA
jgi:predicted MPP superfamily phosphohydrolase